MSTVPAQTLGVRDETGRERAHASFGEAFLSFFFKPSSAHILAVIRIATGAMIAYIHVIWMLNLESFMGPHALISNSTWRALHQGPVPDYKWTYLAQTESMSIIWTHEIVACLAGVLFSVGLLTRTFGIVAWLLTLMTVHRMTGLLFGLDQVTLMLAMYLCLGRPGNVWSVDSWLQQRFPLAIQTRSWVRAMSGLPLIHDNAQGDCLGVPNCWSNTMATRLIQLHLCVIYFFGGVGKMRGEMWWDGSAMWFSFASYEYQSLDMTWTGHFAILSSIATHVTLFWEVSYCALIWPKWTRTWTLSAAFLVHSGIALFLGMFTFGLMMIVANMAFIPPVWLGGLRRDSEH